MDAVSDFRDVLGRMCAVSFAIAGIACGSSRPQVHNNDDDDDAHQHVVTVVPEREMEATAVRPTLDMLQWVPDPTDRGRWPLGMGTHPMLEPHFDVGDALAVPGIGWLELCGRGIQKRILPGNPDPVEYLRAWCSAQNHDSDDAVARLTRLRNSTVPGIRDAIWLDIANVLADNGDAEHATKLINRNHLEHEVDLLDLLAATYVEVGRREDAIELNALAIDADHSGYQDKQCRRFARQIVVADPAMQDVALAALHQRVKKATYKDCAEIEHELRCWVRPSDCDDYLADRGVDRSYRDAVWAYTSWPQGNATSFVWWRIGVSASHAIGVPGADELAITALDAAVRASNCDGTRLTDVRNAFAGIRKTPNRDQRFDARVDATLVTLDRLLKSSPSLCRAAVAKLPS